MYNEGNGTRAEKGEQVEMTIKGRKESGIIVVGGCENIVEGGERAVDGRNRREESVKKMYAYDYITDHKR